MTADIARSFAFSRVERLMPCRAAIAERVSPALTLYVPPLLDDEDELAVEAELDEPDGPRSNF